MAISSLWEGEGVGRGIGWGGGRGEEKGEGRGIFEWGGGAKGYLDWREGEGMGMEDVT